MLAGATVTVALVSALLGPVAYSVETMTSAHTGSIVTAGPTVASASGIGGAGFAPGARGGGANGGAPGNGVAGRAAPGNGTSFGGFAGRGGGTPARGTAGGAPAGGAGGVRAGGAGGAGSLLGSSAVSADLRKILTADAAKYTWVAAAIGSNSAAGYQLATEQPVMPIGGFNGSDPSPTLAEFKADVANGKIHYFIGGGVGQANGGSSASTEIETWVEANFSSKTVGGVTLYDLTSETNQSNSAG